MPFATRPDSCSEEIRTHLDQILQTRDFAEYPRSRALLKYVVEETLDGRADGLKEAIIGIAVFGRDPGYDTKSDSIVRTQARRVRERLVQYYASAPAGAVRIGIPKGGYVPEFEFVQAPPDAPVRKPRQRFWTVAAIALVVIAVGLSIGWRRVVARDVHLSAIAVLPFADLDPTHRYVAFEYGLTEDLERDLSRITGLRIHAKPPADRLTAAERSDYIALSRRLGVDALVDGSVDGSQIRVSLIRATDATILWAGAFPADEAIGTVERNIEEAVAGSLGLTLPTRALTQTENPKAHDLFFAGRTLWATRDPAKTREAIRLFEQAIEIDPNYALAYMGIADAYALMVAHAQIDSKTGIERGEVAARKALELDPSLAEAHAAMGLIEGVKWHTKESEAEYLRAIELNPSYDRAYAREGTLKFAQGDFPAAERLLRESERLNPYAMSLPLIRAELYYYWRRYKDSEDLIREVQKADPGNPTTFQLLSHDEFAEHRPEQALAFARQALTHSPGNPLYEFELIPCLYATGHAAEAAPLLDQALHPKNGQPVDSFGLALMYVRIGEREKTLASLEAALSEHIADLGSMRWDPALDPVRNDPRFKAVVAKLPR
jgi:tetratricopeptide (TPR) repeat protein/TolB-like protein